MHGSRAVLLAAGVVLFACARLVSSTPNDIHEETETRIIPYGNGILPNGFLGTGEWDTERVLHFVACDSVEFLLKQDSQYVYLGIRSLDTNHTGIDLYLGDDHSGRHLLHVSSAHGQKNLPDTAQAELRFGENRLWTANAVEAFYSDDEQQIQAPELFEFQVDKQLIEGRVLRLFVHFKRPERTCPARAVEDSTAGWLEFRL